MFSAAPQESWGWRRARNAPSHRTIELLSLEMTKSIGDERYKISSETEGSISIKSTELQCSQLGILYGGAVRRRSLRANSSLVG